MTALTAEVAGDQCGSLGHSALPRGAYLWFGGDVESGALVDGPKISLARDLRRMKVRDLAQRIGVAASTVSNYEAGRTQPPASTLDAIARALGLPVNFFLEPLEVTPPAVRHYRSRSRIPAAERRYIEAVGDVFEALVSRIQDYLVVPPTQLPALSVEDYSPEEAAIALREEWGLGVGPIHKVVGLLEYHGVWVHVPPSHASEQIDAFSYWQDGTAHVVLNRAFQDPCRWRFDAAHELGHLVLHGHCTGDESRARLEKEANRFASEFLLPSSQWRREAPRNTSPYAHLPTKERWGVSVAAQLYKSNKIGLLTAKGYRSAMVRYSKLGWRSKGEPGGQRWFGDDPEVLSLILDRMKDLGVSVHDLAADLGLGSEMMGEIIGPELMHSNVIPFSRARPRFRSSG